MEKRVLLTAVFLAGMLLLAGLALAITGEAVTGDAVTGKASALNFNVSIRIITGAPAVYIAVPENRSFLPFPFNYFNTNNISLNYSVIDVADVDKAWYSIDNGANISVSGNTTISAADGNHTLRLYANNTLAFTNSTARAISVNASLGWFVCTSKYNGTTTNLTAMIILGKTYMGAISNLTLEIAKYGKIEINETLNISRDLCFYGDNVSYIDDYSDIFTSASPLYNVVYSKWQVPELNKSAIISFYNLSINSTNVYSNPRIVRNNATCPSSECAVESYSNGTLRFWVSYLGAVYSAEETPAAAPVTPAAEEAGAAAGGGGVERAKKIEVDRNEIKVLIRQGESRREQIIVTNIWKEKINVIITAFGIENFVKASPRDFELKAGESKIVHLEFSAEADTNPNLYFGSIKIKGSDDERIISAIIEVASKAPSVGTIIDIPQKYQNLMPDDNIVFNVLLYNVGIEKSADVLVEYTIMDIYGKIYASDEEKMSIMGQEGFTRSIKLPANLPFGDYILYAKTTYKGAVSSSSMKFSVGRISNTLAYIIALAGAVVAASAVIVYILRKKPFAGLIKKRVVISIGRGKAISVSSDRSISLRKIAERLEPDIKNKMTIVIGRNELGFSGVSEERLRNALARAGISRFAIKVEKKD